jgi:hypothetical protein
LVNCQARGLAAPPEMFGNTGHVRRSDSATGGLLATRNGV